MNLLKYPGGKERELKYILSNLPKFNNYFEPFVGGGSVFFNINASQYYINDKSEDLINLYHCVKNGDKDFFHVVSSINYNWILLSNIVYSDREFFLIIYDKYREDKISELTLVDTIFEYLFDNARKFNGMLSVDFNFAIDNFIHEIKKNLVSKLSRMKKLESEKGNLSTLDRISNFECAFKSAFYTHFRYLFNKKEELNLPHAYQVGIFLFIREMCYSSMFRYNSIGEFNVPYGGISYNHKTFDTRINQYKNELYAKLLKTEIVCDDFYNFVTSVNIKENDFVFLDPPYDSDFSTYHKNTFDKFDQERLYNYLLNECVGLFMLIIKRTDFISQLYLSEQVCKNGRKLKVDSFEKKYQVSFKNRNNKNAEHLVITNY